MGKDESSPPDPPLPERSRWVRVLWVFTPLMVVVIALILFLCSNMGMQKVVIPILASSYDIDLKVSHASVGMDGILRADDITIKSLDENGNVTVFARLPAMNVYLLSNDGIKATSDELDLEIIRWPQQPSEKGGSTKDAKASGPFGDFSCSISNINLAIPPMATFEGRAPRFNLTQTDITYSNQQYTVETIGAVNFSECPPSWHWLNQTELVLDASSSQQTDGFLWSGNLRLGKRLSSPPLPELESFSVDGTFTMATNGLGSIDLMLRGKDTLLATLKTNVRGSGMSRSATIELSGPKLTLATNLADTQLAIDAWNSQVDVQWLTADHEFRSVGKATIPGVSVSLPGEPDTFLPALALSGNWEVTKPVKGVLAWTAQADLLKEERTLFQIISSSSGSTPVELKLPACQLEELYFYAQPFGIDLPKGEVMADLKLNRDETGLYKGSMEINVADLEIGRADSKERLSATVTMTGELRPNEILYIDTFGMEGSLSSSDGDHRGNFNISLLRGSPIYFDPRDRLDSPGKLILGLNATLQGRNTNKKDALNIKSRTGLNLTERPQLWIELLGNSRGKTFLQGTVNATMNSDWSLKYMEVSNTNLHNLSASHKELLYNIFGVTLNSLNANAVIRENTEDGHSSYGFSGSVRYSGLKGLPGLPDHLSASQDFKLTGKVDVVDRSLEISQVDMEAQLTDIALKNQPISLIVKSKAPMRIIWSPRFIIERGNIIATADIPNAYLPHGKDVDSTDNLRLTSQLSATTNQDGKRLSALAFSSSFGNLPVLSFNIFGNFFEAGELDVLELNQVKLSVPETLAKSISPTFPAITKARCNGRFKEGQFIFSAVADDIHKLPALPEEHRFKATVSITGNLLKDTIRFETANFICRGSDDNGIEHLVAQGKLSKTGTITLRDIWKPDAISIPLAFTTHTSSRLINQLRLFNQPVTDDLSSTVNLAIGGKTTAPEAAFSGHIRLGDADIINLVATTTMTSGLALKQIDIERCTIVNHDLSPDLLPVPASVTWKQLAFSGSITRNGPVEAFTVTASAKGLNDPISRLKLPVDLDISGSGDWEPGRKHLSFSAFKLNGRSTASQGPPMTFQLAVRDALALDLSKSLPLLASTTPGQLSAHGQLPPIWLAEASGVAPIANAEPISWDGAVSVTPHDTGKQATFELTCKDGKSTPVVLKGKLNHNQRGIPTAGKITASLGWSPVFRLATRALDFERWKQATLTLAVDESGPTGSALSAQWAIDGIESLAKLPASHAINGEGHLRTWLSADGNTFRLDTFKHEFTNVIDNSSLSVVMDQPCQLLPRFDIARLSLASTMTEPFLMKMTGATGTTNTSRHEGLGTCVITPAQQGLKLSLNSTVTRDASPGIEFECDMTLDRKLMFKQAAIKSFTIHSTQQYATLVPIFSKATCTKGSLTGMLTRKSTGYYMNGNVVLTNWRHTNWTSASLAEVSLSVAAQSPEGTTFKLTNLDVNGEVVDYQKATRISRFSGKLVEPGSVSFAGPAPLVRGKVSYSGSLTHLPQLKGTLPPGNLNGTMDVTIPEFGQLRLKTTVNLTDDAGEIMALDVLTEGDMSLRFRQLNVQKAAIAYRPWLSKSFNLGNTYWKNANATFNWTRAADTGALKGPYTLFVSGLNTENNPLMVVSAVHMKGIGGMKHGSRPTLEDTQLTWHGKSPQGDVLFSFLLSHEGTTITIPEDWTAFSPGELAVKGKLNPALIRELSRGMTTSPHVLKAPLQVDGSISLSNQQYKANLAVKHNQRAFLTVKPEYDATKRFGGITVSSQSVPDNVVNALFSRGSFPTYKKAELKISARPGVDDSLMVYTTAEITDFRDRRGMTETVDLKLDSHCEFIKEADGGFAANAFPLQISWGEDAMFTCVGDISTDLSETWNLRLRNGQVPLPKLFLLLNKHALSPGMSCRNGVLETTASITLKPETWVTNTRLVVKDAVFGPVNNGEGDTTSFDWNVVINGKGQYNKVSDILITTKGPGWNNNATLRASWIADQNAPRSLSLLSESSDFTPLWNIFRRRSTYPLEGGDITVNLYDWLPQNDTLKTLKADYSVTLSNIDIGPLQLDDTLINIVADGGRLEVTSCSMELNGGDIAFSGFLEATDKASRLSHKLVISELPLKPVMSMIYDAESNEKPRGTLTLTTTFDGSGKTLPEALKNAKGTGNFAIEDFRFYRQDHLVKPAADASIPDLEYLDFETVSADLDISGGTLKTTGFEMRRDELILKATIAVNADGTLTISDLGQRFALSHYNRFLIGKAGKLFGFGPSEGSQGGFKVFTLPVTMVHDASGWTVKALDSSLYKPFKSSAIGKWLIPSSSKETD